MTTSYETFEIIASHHAEIDRLCTDLLELGGRVAADDAAVETLRERARALAWRIREHLTEESAALMSDAGEDGARIADLLERRRQQGERIQRALADAERSSRGPLELVSAVCAIARDVRACFDRVALA